MDEDTGLWRLRRGWMNAWAENQRDTDRLDKLDRIKASNNSRLWLSLLFMPTIREAIDSVKEEG